MTTPTPTYHSRTDGRYKISALEQRVLNDLAAAGLPIVQQVKRHWWVFDAAVQGTWILIEINGEYWHKKTRAKERDARKAAWCQQFGYTLITIWEAIYLEDPIAAIDPAITAYRAAVPAALLVPAVLPPDTEGPSVSGGSTKPPIEIVPSPGDWTALFLNTLSQTGIVLDACQAAGVTRQTAYERREKDSQFKQAWQYALQDAADVAMRVYRQRGITESDRAMEFFIRSRDPETVTSDMTITIQINWPQVPDTLLDAYLAGRITLKELQPYAVQNQN